MHSPGSALAQDLVARRLTVGFASVSVTAVVMSALLIGLLAEVSSVVTEMHRQETAIREGLSLATAVREQYIHQAHWLIERNDDHLAHSDEWLARALQSVAVLRPLVPAIEQVRLETIARQCAELEEVFRTSVRPAAERQDAASVAREHHRAQELSQRASENADALARAMEAQMAGSHDSATQATTSGLIAGVLGIFLVLVLAVIHTLRLRKAVLQPLAALSDAARRYGSGDFDTRLGDIGDGELNAVATAFDRMADELEAREQRLITTERMAAIGQLAAGVAHEINNPIGIIRGYIQTMGPDTPAEVLVEELAILDEEAAACQRIAEDLVTFSHTPRLERGMASIERLVETAVERFRGDPRWESVDVQHACDPAQLILDGGRIRQVLLNLLANAAQASGDDCVIEISGGATTRGDLEGYRIDVSDRGPGVPRDEREKVFEPFYSRRKGGSGLGLAVCQGIAIAHGGHLSVHERPSGGATFRLFLPHAHRTDQDEETKV